jgi:hypothetical protein
VDGHYASDTWTRRKYPGAPLERYADGKDSAARGPLRAELLGGSEYSYKPQTTMGDSYGIFWSPRQTLRSSGIF